MEIGQLLKEERIAQKLSLEDIQEMTKIQKRYLKAIENNDFNSLPGRFYARAFIKEYALVLNMDHHALVEAFENQEEMMEEEDTTQYTSVSRSRSQSRASKSSAMLSFLPKIIVVILIIGILFVAWILTQKALSNDRVDTQQPTESDEIIRDVEKDEAEKPVSDDETEAENEEEEVVEKEEEAIESGFEVDEVGTGNPPESELTFTYGEDQATLSFDVEAEAYVAIVGESGKTYFDGILNPGTETEDFDITEEETIYLNVGNTTGLTVKLNDIPMEYSIEPSERVHQKFIIHLEKQE